MLQLLSRSRYAVQLEDLQNPNVVRELQGSEVAGKGDFTLQQIGLETRLQSLWSVLA